MYIYIYIYAEDVSGVASFQTYPAISWTSNVPIVLKENERWEDFAASHSKVGRSWGCARQHL